MKGIPDSVERRPRNDLGAASSGEMNALEGPRHVSTRVGASIPAGEVAPPDEVAIPHDQVLFLGRVVAERASACLLYTI
jgi:hypothetical protein